VGCKRQVSNQLVEDLSKDDGIFEFTVALLKFQNLHQHPPGGRSGSQGEQCYTSMAHLFYLHDAHTQGVFFGIHP